MKLPRPGVLTGTVRRIASHGRVWLRDPEGRRDERAASSLAVFFMFFPLVIGAFGFGIDLSRNIWVRHSIQNAVDSAAVGGAAVTVTNKTTGKLEVDKAKAPAAMRKLYALNRANNPGLTCIGKAPQCWKEVAAKRVDVKVKGKPQPIGTVYRVNEQSKNAFLGFLGSPVQNYDLEGKAKLTLDRQ